MNATLIVTALIGVVVIGLNIMLLLKIARANADRKQELEREAQGEDRATSLLLQQMNEITRQLQEQTRHSGDSTRAQTSDLQRALDSVKDQVTRHLVEVTKGVTETNQTSKQMLTIADQLNNLEKVLKHQKQRGNLGEASLELILGNILPPTAYKMQYRFPDGEAVDAVIMTKEGVIPIDAKFSLDNYTRLVNETDDIRRADLEKAFRNDIVKRIDETAKYVRPKDGTLPFAFMFIPAEGIYYDLLINEIGTIKSSTRNLLDYAHHEKKVIIVSPTTFSAYLQSVLYGFKAFKIEESATQIIKQVGELQKHLKNYEEYHDKLGKSLSTTVSHFNQSNKTFRQIDKDVVKITGEKMGVDPLVLEKPEVGEE